MLQMQAKQQTTGLTNGTLLLTFLDVHLQFSVTVRSISSSFQRRPTIATGSMAQVSQPRMRGRDNRRSLPNRHIPAICRSLVPSCVRTASRMVTIRIQQVTAFELCALLRTVAAASKSMMTAAAEANKPSPLIRGIAPVQALVMALRLRCSQLEGAPSWTTGSALCKTAPGSCLCNRSCTLCVMPVSTAASNPGLQTQHKHVSVAFWEASKSSQVSWAAQLQQTTLQLCQPLQQLAAFQTC